MSVIRVSPTHRRGNEPLPVRTLRRASWSGLLVTALEGGRIGVMLPGAAAYGFALAVIGVRLAAKVAEGTLPEMCQAALHTAL